MPLVRELTRDGALRLTGKDRVRFLNGIVTNDVKALAPGDGCRAGILTVKGRLAGEMIVYACDDALVLDVPPAAAQPVHAALDRYLIADDVVIEDRAAAEAAIGVYGDDAREALGRAIGASLDGLTRPYQHQTIAHDAGSVRVAVAEELGRRGFRVYGESARIATLARELVAAGGEPLDEARVEVLRVEAGEPRFGVDSGEERLPTESRLESLLSHTKGCYLGQEVIVRLRDQGHLNWRLMGLRLDGDGAAAPRSQLSAPGRDDAGEITSSVVSPRFGAIALAYVHRTLWATGTRLTLSGGGRGATVVELPFA